MKNFVPVLLILLGLILLPTANGHAEIRVTELSEPEPVGSFLLENHRGEKFTETSFQGGWGLSLIGYTYCPDVCPFVLSNLAEVLSEMSLRVRPDNLPNIYFIAVDPKRDKENLAQYVEHFGRNVVGVTGEKGQLDQLVKGLDGFYSFEKPDEDGDYIVNHSASVIVTNPDGLIQAKLSPPLAPGEVAEYLARQQIIFNREKRKD